MPNPFRVFFTQLGDTGIGREFQVVFLDPLVPQTAAGSDTVIQV